MLSPAAIKQRAAGLGFDLCGIAPASDFPELGFLSDWLARGYAGEMAYMERSADVRADIRHFLPTARSVIVTGTIYNTDPGAGSREPGAGDARSRSRVTPGRGLPQGPRGSAARAGRWMRPRRRAVRRGPFVDKRQVQERVYAQHAGLGWIGKNTCVINPELGSWMFLSGIATSLDSSPMRRRSISAAACTLCIDACPTGAIVDAARGRRDAVHLVPHDRN